MTASIHSFLSVVLLISCLSAASSRVDEVCDSLAGWYVAPQLCRSVLSSDPESLTAELDGIGIIASNIAAANATSVVADIERMLSNGSLDSNQQKALNTCLELYTGVIPELKAAAESIKAKKYSAAETALFTALKVPAYCNDAAKDDPTVRAWMDHDDAAFSNVMVVAHALAAYIIRHNS